MSAVAEVQACTVRVPLSRPLSFSTRAVQAREYCLVRVRDEDGVEGIGFNYAGTSGGSVVATAASATCSPGWSSARTPTASRACGRRCTRKRCCTAATGAVMRALSAIDIALWDRNARAVGLPLWRYPRRGPPRLGAGLRQRRLLPRRARRPELLAEEVRGYVEQGFKAVKIKVGRLRARRRRKNASPPCARRSARTSS